MAGIESAHTGEFGAAEMLATAGISLELLGVIAWLSFVAEDIAKRNLAASPELLKTLENAQYWSGVGGTAMMISGFLLLLCGGLMKGENPD